INELSREASNLITEYSKKDSKIITSLLEMEDCYKIICNKLLIKVDKSACLVSIYKEGILQHGGAIGDDDTVVPSYQLRVLNENNISVLGKFNFKLDDNDEFYGLGDKSGIPNKAKRVLKFFNKDSMGYDAEIHDPLYKSIPFFIKLNKINKSLCGILIDSALIDSMNFGVESPLYYNITTYNGPFSYYYFDGNSYSAIVNNYLNVTGRPAFPPLFSFGFLGSSMNYVEGYDAQERIERYFKQTEENNIPCEGMYVSSGYLKQPNGKRYAFIWNKQKFSDPKKFITDLRDRGYKLAMNIKPGILTTHPWYKELCDKGYFIKDEKGNPYTEFYWGGEASFINYTNKDAYNWWKDQLIEQFLDNNCAGIWNDNNEFEIEDSEVDLYKIKSVLPMMMCSASYDAFKEKDKINNENNRAWIISRSGFSGIQRYARTWSGDNSSDWKTLKFNQYQSIGFGLSGIPFYGHDLGGFYGNVPTEELLVRSCESAILQPRFVIHSWRADGNPTEAWSYKDSLPVIRNLIIEHYKFMPYIYTASYDAVVNGKQMDRSLYLEFLDDENLSGMETDSMFGDNILKTLVVDKGISKRFVYLPKGVNWYSGVTSKYSEGGQTVEIGAKLGVFNYFVKEGSIIPRAVKAQKLKTALYDELELRLYKVKGDIKKESIYFEDDGKTNLEDNKYNLFSFIVTKKKVTITKVKDGIKGENRVFTLTDNEGIYIKSFDPDSMEKNDKIFINL
ncbi:TIM-barrel domain-containing protein, partial [Clostridium sp.]|uniref:TIM-barrel domain-containing protein n=1 Tax=Clostridium sp. TaxID=1506 RepID=UPI001A3D6E1E